MRSRRLSLEFRSVVTTAGLIALVCGLGLVSTLPLLGRAPQSDTQQGAVGSRIWLRDAQPIAVQHVGAAKTVQAMASAQPLALANGDFDADGVVDLVVGYASANGGILAFHRGNLDAFAPQSEASFQAIAHGQFPSPFLPTALLVDVPVRPDFVAVGSLNGEGYPDVIFAQRGDSSIYLMTNDTTGKFSAAKAINVGGPITSLAAGDLGQHGIYSKLLVGISDHSGSHLMVYTGTLNGLGGVKVLSLPGPASNINFGHLGDIGQDAIFVAGGRVQILHSSSLRLETLSLPITAQSIALGSFIWDRNPQLQIAVMDPNGSVHIAAHNEFDPRAYSTAELSSVHRIGKQGRFFNPLARAKTVPMNGWKIVETLSGIAPSSGAAPVLLRTRISDHGADDVMVLNGHTGQMTVIAHPDAAPGSSAFAPAEISYRPYNGSPTAAISMRTNVDGRPGVVAIYQGQVAPSLMMPLPDPTFFPNRFDDPAPPTDLTTICNNTSNTDTSSDCSLREAVLRANATSGTDTITLAAGTYTLSIARQQNNATSPPTVDYSGRHGALYVNDSLNIVGQVDGSGNATSIIQAGTNATNGVDMVMAVNEDINPLTNASASISNVIFQFGRNTGSDFAAGATAATQDGDGGCMEFDTGTSGNATLNLQNVTLQHCSTTNGEAGGIALFDFLVPAGSGGATINNSIIQNNAPFVTLAGAGGSSAGGIASTITGNGTASVPFKLTLTNSKVLNNLVTEVNHPAGGGTAEPGVGGGIFIIGGCSSGFQLPAIHNTVISGNQAAGEGGGILATCGFVLDQGSVVSNNSAGSAGAINNVSGGGIYMNISPNTATISKVTITGNSTTGDGGGIHVDDSGGTVNISFSRIVNNTAGGKGSNLNNRNDLNVDNGTIVTATNNWWGTNTPSTTLDPSTSTCPAGPRQICFDPWIELTHAASPSKIRINQSSTLTADMSKDNHGNGVALAGNLDEIVGLPITFDNPVLGTIQQAQPETLGNPVPTATATYNAGGVGGQGHADATVDNATVTADIVVLQPPSIVKSFNPTTVALNTPSAVSFAITNGNVVTINSSFTDSLPSGVVVSPTPAVVNGCVGTVTATAGSGSISFSNSSLAVGTCTISVNVQSAVDNVYSNSVQILSTDAGNGNTSSASLTVISPPAITKSFGASSIPLNGTTSLSFAISNPNTNSTLNGVAFTDTLPTGLVIATPNGLSSTCGGTATAVAGSGAASLSGASLAPGASCTVSANVKGTTAGTKSNSVQVSSTNGGTGNTSTASLVVIAPPTINQVDSLGGSVSLNSVDTLEFTITNPNPTPISLSGIGFTDTLSSGLAVAAGANNINCGGTLTAVVGAQTFSLSGVTLAAGANCSLNVNVTGTAAGNQTSNTSAVTSTEGGSGGTTSVPINVVAPPSIAKAFSPSTIAVNGTSSLQFTITNPTGNTVSETGVAFQDTLPTGLTVASATSTVCGGTLQTFSGTNAITLSGATVAVGTPCTFSVTVTGAASGQYTNTTAHVTSVNGGQGNTATANLTVASPASITKSFGAASIPLNGTTTLSFALSNPNSGLGLSGVSFTDTLPAGLVVASTPNLSNTCNGTATATAGGGSVTLSGGTLASTASCTFSVNVQGTTVGVKNNSVQVTSTEGGTGNTSNASITVVGPPALSKAFGAASIPLNGTTSLSFTVTNPNTTVGLTGVGFTDTLPSNLTVSTPNGLTGSCGSGTISAAGSAISLSAGSLASGGTCTFSVNVTGVAAGTASNTTSAVTSTEGGTGNTGSASIFVVAPPSIAKVFNPSAIALNATTSLNFTITNPTGNTTSELGVAFADTLPTGLTVASSTSAVCGGTLVTTAPTGIALSGASVAAGTPCQFSVTVTGAASGSYTNTTGNVTSTNGGAGNTATAGLTVATPPSMTKSFGATTIPLNGTTSMTFAITNPNSGQALTGVQFTDTLPAGLIVSSPTATNTCGGTATVGAGGLSLSLSGGSLAASASCSVSATVEGTTAGVKNNSATVSSSNAGAGSPATASITVVAPASLAKSFGAASIPLNGATSLSFTVTNPNTTVALSGVGFTDTLPSNLAVSTPNGLSGSCGAGTISATAAGSGISLSGGSVAAGGACTFSVNVTGKTAGTANNTTSAVTSNEGGTGNSANASLLIVAPPSVSKAFGATTVAVNGTTSLTLTITNPNTAATLNGVAITDTFPSGLAVAATANLSTTCGGTASGTSNSISLTGGSIAAGGSCTLSANVTPTTSGPKVNTTGNVSSTNGGTGNTGTATLQAGDFNLSLSPSTETVPPGHMGTFTLTASSPSGFQGAISLTCSGGPPGSKCSLVPNSVTLVSGSEMAQVTINLAVPKGASKGTFTITITGTGGGLTHTATAILKVGLN